LPIALTAIFAAGAVVAGAFRISLILLVLLYTALPVGCAVRRWNFAAILLIWLPIEFAAGQSFVPPPARGFLHSVGYGIAILLGLALFLGYLNRSGLKYNLPRAGRDFRLPLASFALLAPVLIVVGVAIGFIPPPHLPVQPAGKMAAAIGIIFVGTALPEEILFRSLIQNLLMQRFGATTRTLLAASLIFGAAHLDNGPQALPNWRYMIVATIAGFAYGKVFQKATSVTSSAMLHMMVDWTKHFFF
jgi:membrane protease YdiL (CAAX protease family)